MDKYQYIVSLGDRIRKMRIEKNLTQQQLADACKKTRSWLCKIETGVNDIPLPELQKLADTFEVDISVFFNKEQTDYVYVPSEDCQNALISDFTDEEIILINTYRKLSENGKEKVKERIAELTKLEEISK